MGNLWEYIWEIYRRYDGLWEIYGNIYGKYMVMGQKASVVIGASPASGRLLFAAVVLLNTGPTIWLRMCLCGHGSKLGY